MWRPPPNPLAAPKPLKVAFPMKRGSFEVAGREGLQEGGRKKDTQKGVSVNSCVCIYIYIYIYMPDHSNFEIKFVFLGVLT